MGTGSVKQKCVHHFSRSDNAWEGIVNASDVRKAELSSLVASPWKVTDSAGRIAAK